MTEQGNLKWDSRYKLDTWINCVEMMLQHCYEGHTCHHGNTQHLETNPQPLGHCITWNWVYIHVHVHVGHSNYGEIYVLTNTMHVIPNSGQLENM